MATVYILYSNKLKKHYIGSCNDIEERLNQHNNHIFKNSFTKRAEDWIVFYKCKNIEYNAARKIEFHIKEMKSKTYYENLLKYEDIMLKLIERYSSGSCR